VFKDAGIFQLLKMGARSLSWGKVARAWQWPPNPRVKKEQNHTSTPSLGLHGLFNGELYLCQFAT
jgi:hypothetical protein